MENTKALALAFALCCASMSHASENIALPNCMRHLGGGGMGDFDCYEGHTKSLEADNAKFSSALEASKGVDDGSKVRLSGYLKTEDEVARACELAINIEYPTQEERSERNHVELYDVMAAQCRYRVRKQQNEFLRDLYSITNDYK